MFKIKINVKNEECIHTNKLLIDIYLTNFVIPQKHICIISAIYF